MNYIKFILLLLSSILFALELDVESLMKKVSTNPHDIKNRLVLAKYFFSKKEYKKAKQFLEEVLKIEPSNLYAIQMKKKIEAINYILQLTKNNQTLDDVINKYYQNNKYKEILKIYHTLVFVYPSKKNILKDESYLKIAKVAMLEGNYELALKILDKIQDKKNLNFFEIKAYSCYYLSNFDCAKKYFQYLFKATEDIEYAKKLLDIYINIGDIKNAKKILLSIKRTHKLSKNNDFTSYEKKIAELENEYIKNLKKKYSKNPTFENLKPLVFTLYSKNPKEGIDLVKDYIKNNPKDDRAKILLAKLLSWNGNNKEALKILTKLQKTDDIETKLLFGKILAWQGEYDKAIKFLSDVYKNGSKAQKYEAKKMIGYIYLWKNQKEDAKKIFEELLKINPNDEDIKESLLVIKGNIKPIIKKYKKLLAQNPTDETIILKLAEYYYMAKEYKKALKYYKKYLTLDPDKIEIYKKIGDIYFELKDYHKAFGAWEYYANYKGTKEGFYQLAQRYYWHGFNNEALSILNNLLKKYPNYKKAKILKAKILKINPRFVISKKSTTIDKYFYNRSKKILLLADRAYFENLYSSSTDYYKTYLSLQPDDYKARERYAFALELSKEYEKAAGEFYLLLWMDNRPDIMYHYAYNLQKSGNIKKAKEIYIKLLNKLSKKFPPFIDKFLKEWKNAWESMNFKKYSSFYGENFLKNTKWKLKKKEIFKKSGFIKVNIYSPTLIHQKGNLYRIKFYQIYLSKIRIDRGYKTLDIVCKNKVCKIIKETWEPGKYIPDKNKYQGLEVYIKQRLKEIQNSNKKNTTVKNIAHSKDRNQTFGIDGTLNYFQDNKNIEMLTHQFKVYKKINNIWLYLFFSNYILNDNTKIANGDYYGIGIKKGNFYGDIVVDKSGSNGKIGWSLTYLTKFFNYGLTFKLNKRNLVYSKHTYNSKEFMRLKGEITGYKSLKSKREFWWSIAEEKIDNNNFVTTLQFNYDFYEEKFDNLYLLYTLVGWYQLNFQTTSYYYSPNKADNNLIGLKGYYPLNGKINLQTKGFLGYSFLQKTLLYKISIWLKAKNNNFSSEIGCDFSNSSSVNIDSKYKSLECNFYIRKFW